MARARAAASARWTSRPVTPSITTSGVPPTAVATTGRPAAISSNTTTGSPSVCEDEAARSHAGSTRSKSLRKPANTKRPCKPRSAIRFVRFSRSGPSPKRTKPAPGSWAATSAAASISRSKPFSGLSRPAAAMMRSGRSRKKLLQFLPANRVGRAEAIDADGVADHGRAILSGRRRDAL